MGHQASNFVEAPLESKPTNPTILRQALPIIPEQADTLSDIGAIRIIPTEDILRPTDPVTYELLIVLHPIDRYPFAQSIVVKIWCGQIVECWVNKQGGNELPVSIETKQTIDLDPFISRIGMGIWQPQEIITLNDRSELVIETRLDSRGELYERLTHLQPNGNISTYLISNKFKGLTFSSINARPKVLLVRGCVVTRKTPQHITRLPNPAGYKSKALVLGAINDYARILNPEFWE